MGEGEYTVKTSRIVQPGANATLCAPNPRRVALLISQAVTGATFTVATAGWGAANAQFNVPTSGYLEFVYTKHGPLVAGGFVNVNASALADLFVTEVLTIDSQAARKETV